VRTFVRIVTAISQACGVLAALALIAACLAVCEMVFVRYVLASSTIWQTEFVLYAVVAATLIGSPYVLSQRGHVNVDLVSQFLGRRARFVLRLVSAGVGLLFCAVLAWSGWRYFHEAWSLGWVTESVWAPRLWVILLPLPLGVGLLCLQYCADLLTLIDSRAHSADNASQESAGRRA
jgi:TRAP-type C4-dicarboxylate transport system permease small subunit